MSVQVLPSAEFQTSLLQIRGKCFLSPGFQPPISHILFWKTRAPAPSRGAKAAFGVTCSHWYADCAITCDGTKTQAIVIARTCLDMRSPPDSLRVLSGLCVSSSET